MSNSARIPVPFSRRLRRFRIGTLPLLTFAACAAGTLWLWERQGVVPNALGEVEAVRVDVASGIDGQLVALPHGQWTLFDVVEANEVVAQLDPTPTLASLEGLRRDIARLEEDAEAEQARLVRTEAADDVKPDPPDTDDDAAEKEQLPSDTPALVDAIRASWVVEAQRLEVIDSRIQLEVDRSSLAQLDARLDQSKRSYARGMQTEDQLNLAQLERDLMSKRVENDLLAVAAAEQRRTEADERLAAHPALTDVAALRSLTPFRAAVATHEARMRELQIQIEGLAIRAPITGTISAVHGWPGQLVRSGQRIVTIAANHGQYIVSYVRQDQRLKVEVGAPVSVYLRGRRGQRATAKVERLGPQFVSIPDHQRRDPNVREWGLPVRIALPDELSVRPGELVDIVFKN